MLCFKKEPVSPVSRFGVAGLLQQNRFCIFQRFRPDPMGPDGTRWDPMMGPDDGTRWDPMGPGSFRSFRSKVLIRRFLNSNRSNLIHFQWFPMIAWLIYGYLWYDLLGPLWTPPKAAFQSRLAAVRPQGDPRVAPWWCHAVKRSGTFTHPLRQRSLQYYAILFEYYLNIVWILFEYYLNIM